MADIEQFQRRISSNSSDSTTRAIRELTDVVSTGFQNMQQISIMKMHNNVSNINPNSIDLSGKGGMSFENLILSALGLGSNKQDTTKSNIAAMTNLLSTQTDKSNISAPNSTVLGMNIENITKDLETYFKENKENFNQFEISSAMRYAVEGKELSIKDINNEKGLNKEQKDLIASYIEMARSIQKVIPGIKDFGEALNTLKALTKGDKDKQKYIASRLQNMSSEEGKKYLINISEGIKDNSLVNAINNAEFNSYADKHLSDLNKDAKNTVINSIKQEITKSLGLDDDKAAVDKSKLDTLKADKIISEEDYNKLIKNENLTVKDLKKVPFNYSAVLNNNKYESVVDAGATKGVTFATEEANKTSNITDEQKNKNNELQKKILNDLKNNQQIGNTTPSSSASNTFNSATSNPLNMGGIEDILKQILNLLSNAITKK